MNNQILDQAELKLDLSTYDFSNLNKVERLIKILSIVCILVSAALIVYQFSLAHHAWKIGKGSAYSLLLAMMIVFWLTFFLPLLYIFIWKKTLNHFSNKNITAFRRWSNFLIVIGIISILISILWLIYSTVVLLTGSFSGYIDYIELLKALAGLILVTNHGLQLWYYLKTYWLYKDYREWLLN